jgi:hypothetical protein
MLEGCRLAGPAADYRHDTISQTIVDLYPSDDQILHLAPGTTILANLHTANHDAGAFLEPESVHVSVKGEADAGGRDIIHVQLFIVPPSGSLTHNCHET